MVKFNVKEGDNFSVVEFEIEGGVITPEELKKIVPPQVNAKKGIVLSGRGPVWLFAMLTHFYHPAAWVATFDPRLGAVVVESHVPDVSVGDVVPVNC